MKQLILIADSDPRTTIVGGVGTYTYQLAKQLYSKYSLTFLGKKQEGKLTKVPFNVTLVTKESGLSNIAFAKGLVAASKKLKTSTKDIIHAQRPDWLLSFKKHKAKKIVTLHGSHYKNIKCKKGLLWAKLYRFLEKKGIALADKVIAVDHETQKEYQKWYPKHAQKIVYYPVGVDTSIFKGIPKSTARKQLGLPAKKKTYLYVGRFSKEKRLHEMIKNLNTDEKLILVGTGELLDELKSLAKGKDIDFPGRKSPSELISYYSAADAFLLFSTHEGLPTVVLEAQSCGIPVLSTPVGEVPRLITNGKNGYVGINYRELMDQKLSPLMKKHAREMTKEYNWKKIAQSIHNEVYS